MKRILLFAVGALLFAGVTYGQTEKRYNDYLVKETNPVVLKYTDPYFPTEAVVPGVKNDKMEEYAKLHPPITVSSSAGPQATEQAQAEWLQLNPYYPQFVPYHLYNYLLTPEDDVAIYEAAKAAWIKANPDKFVEIQNASK
jgi:hypothetical protein